jgi:hypothetical protein
MAHDGTEKLNLAKRRMVMKRHRDSTTLAIACLAVLVLSTAAQAGAQKCSVATVAGNWGFTTTGSIPGIGPLSAVGLATNDKLGNVSGSQTRSLNGAVAEETFTGTITVKPDCTATEVVQVFQNGVLVRTSILNFVIDDNGRSARAIVTSIVLPDGTKLSSILTLDLRRVFDE